jgi:hypothetical protein
MEPTTSEREFPYLFDFNFRPSIFIRKSVQFDRTTHLLIDAPKHFHAAVKLTRCQAMMQPLPSPRYQELRTDADTRDDRKGDTGDDKAESLSGYEDEERAWSDITARDPGMEERRLSRRRRIWSAVMSIRSLVDTVLLFVILGLLLERGWQRPSWFEIGGDITGFAPRSEC